MMFKALLLQRLYELSDVELEEVLYDRLSFRRFCGAGLGEAVPDHMTHQLPASAADFCNSPYRGEVPCGCEAMTGGRLSNQWLRALIRLCGHLLPITRTVRNPSMWSLRDRAYSAKTRLLKRRSMPTARERCCFSIVSTQAISRGGGALFLRYPNRCCGIMILLPTVYGPAFEARTNNRQCNIIGRCCMKTGGAVYRPFLLHKRPQQPPITEHVQQTGNSLAANNDLPNYDESLA
jgi:hypothetical protein